MLDVDFMIPRWLFAALQSENPSAPQYERTAACARASAEGFPLDDEKSEFAHVWADASRRHAFVLPAFELKVRAPCTAGDLLALGNSSLVSGGAGSAHPSCMHFPGDKTALAAAVQREWADVFHSNKKAHTPSDTSRWLHTSHALYYVTWRPWYEPYVIMNASLSGAPTYDVRFVDRGENKVIWAHVAHMRGFRFAVLPSPFVVHVWESKKKEAATRRPMFSHRNSLYDSVIETERRKRTAARAGGSSGHHFNWYKSAPKLSGYEHAPSATERQAARLVTQDRSRLRAD
jgi:hypothetical protein